VKPTPITRANTGKRTQPRPSKTSKNNGSGTASAGLRALVKNNVVLDLKRDAAEVWLVGPAAGDLDKNNLALSQLLFLTSGGNTADPSRLSKRKTFWSKAGNRRRKESTRDRKPVTA
jgi:hypothetical protein